MSGCQNPREEPKYNVPTFLGANDVDWALRDALLPVLKSETPSEGEIVAGEAGQRHLPRPARHRGSGTRRDPLGRSDGLYEKKSSKQT